MFLFMDTCLSLSMTVYHIWSTSKHDYSWDILTYDTAKWRNEAILHISLNAFRTPPLVLVSTAHSWSIFPVPPWAWLYITYGVWVSMITAEVGWHIVQYSARGLGFNSTFLAIFPIPPWAWQYITYRVWVSMITAEIWWPIVQLSV